jgi:hypothetical protein
MWTERRLKAKTMSVDELVNLAKAMEEVALAIAKKH